MIRTASPLRLLRLLTAGLVVALLGVAWAADEPKPTTPQELKVGAYRLSGPYHHDNLTLYLIHGEDQLKNKKLLTLQEAIEQKKVVVHETGTVNELSVENVSGEDVFIQGGDIVKGGQQDRVIAVDLVVPPKSGKMPVGSFCVESGRWSQRAGENVRMFSGSSEQLATKDLKLAARQAGDQGRVWDKVAVAQMLLSRNVGANVQAGESASSLQLTLEHKKLVETLDAYLKKFTPLPEGKTDVVGMAFAINGKINSAEVFASPALFQKLWPKMIKACAVEAVVEMQKDKKFEAVPLTAVRDFMQEVEKGKASQKEITKRIQALQKETEKNILFQTEDKAQPGLILRRSYIAK